ncbi:alpha-1A adrenergic receptor [Sphaerodactylus townsendi]|uniref:alpha-1A adrenergic receptor n=1 Tax=Sphaerodactylus townsendi TaxID=933632 RepID=UPI002026F109|nr:alpha-1A adrenergic receptor [Sphaerodactylus townsendi]XP_048368876.1 alpha-1A adrenergic receptor [Sphaerodactylus townsendi]XP_048368877.1 alpha-1A adrenergic receptor [Sphaerodactylus townsendi]XP_048368878.1 alpha-1A adrenergic receptor [Sphaerodactylus townsendi]XP_048368880.1 alpha-1A adrenergic receptor [Sphaerodactylus townsendi]
MGSTSGNFSECLNCTQTVDPVSVSKAILLGVILGGLIIFGVLGNILVILAVACHRHLQSVTHYCIINLAVADLLLTSTVLPFSAIFEILGYWVFGRIFCNIWAAVDVLCCTASIMSLCVISIDRYIGVSYPLRYPTIVTEKRGLLALLCVWALSLVISIGPLFGWKQPAPDDEKICQINTDPGYVLFSALGSFYLPLVIILVMYCRVYVVARRESKGLSCGLKTEKSHSEEVTLRIHRKNTTDPRSTPNSKHKSHFSVRLLKFSREKKAAKSLGIVVGCFILCWLPFFLIMPIGSFFPASKPSDTVFKIAFWLGYLNSCINPIIYPCSSQEFKKAFINVLRAQCLQRRNSANKYSLNFNLNHPSSHVAEPPKNVVRIPVGSGETFYKISKSDGICEWKLFSAMQGMPTKSPTPKDKSSCATAKVKSKGFLRVCCCAGTSGNTPQEDRKVPAIKIHTISISDNGEDV